MLKTELTELSKIFFILDAVSLLLDHSHNLRTNTLSIIEASVRGYTGVVELLLDYGVDPNGLDPTKETGPLHEAVRFLR